MRKMLISIAAPALLVAAVPASAQDAAQAPARDNSASEQQPQNASPDRRICVDVELTGSRMNHRICRTAREWEERGGLERIR
jgi:hypothetical protein